MIQILQGDVFSQLPTIQPGSVDCICTSPPYWKLRSYLPKNHALKHLELGSEPTVQEYIANQVRVFRLVRTAMADHATCWVNIGDTYSSGMSGQSNLAKWSASAANGHQVGAHTDALAKVARKPAPGFEQGNLCLIPQRLAIALQEPYEHDLCVKEKTDRAWLAAIFDGEGCIGIRHSSKASDKAKGWQDNYSAYSCVAMSDKNVIDRCVAITGLGKVAIKSRAGDVDKRGVNQRRDQHGWRLDGPPSVEVIMAIYPYLVAKKKQAALAYTLDSLNKTRAARNCPVASEIQEKKETLYKLIKQCNQRESVDLPDWVEEPKPHFGPGFIVRSVIVWHKPAPMPASVAGWRWMRCRVKCKPSAISRTAYTSHATSTPNGLTQNGGIDGSAEWSDCPGCSKCEPNGGYVLRRGSWRPTSSWEPVLMLAKKDRYYCDGEAVKTPPAAVTVERDKYTRVLDDEDEQFAVRHDHETECVSGANLRDVWTIAAEPLKEKHYAAYPTELVKRCLMAGTSSKGYCPACGLPWCRVIESTFVPQQDVSIDRGVRGAAGQKQMDASNGWEGMPRGTTESKTLAWRPSCNCIGASEMTPRPGLVLDPFAGSGRTGIAATRLGLDFVGVELNSEYAEMCERRICGDSPLFNEVLVS